MKRSACVILGVFFALVLISYAASGDQTQDQIKTKDANDVADQKQYGGWDDQKQGGGGGGGGGGNGGGGGGGGGSGGGGGGGGGLDDQKQGGGYRGGWSGGCRWRCGSRCCNTAQEASAYMKNQAQP